MLEDSGEAVVGHEHHLTKVSELESVHAVDEKPDELEESVEVSIAAGTKIMD